MFSSFPFSLSELNHSARDTFFRGKVSKGQVVVSARMLKDFSPDQGVLIEFRIKDSGISIEPDRQTGLFQSFVQVDVSTTRKYGGTGLGLAICKRLVRLMGGRIGLESTPGEGSTFWFTARLGHAEAPKVAMLSDLHLVSLAGKHVVVVDDTPLNLRILDKQLRRWAWRPCCLSALPKRWTGWPDKWSMW